MDFIDALDIFTLCGGLVGACIGVDAAKYGRVLSIFIVVGAVILAGAVGDYVEVHYSVKDFWLRAAIGLAVGIPAGSMMDALRLASPKLAEKLINAGGNKLVNKITGDKDE